MAQRLPYRIVMPEIMISRFDHCAVMSGTAVNNTRNSRTKPAAFEPTARNAVAGVGAPW